MAKQFRTVQYYKKECYGVAQAADVSNKISGDSGKIELP